MVEDQGEGAEGVQSLHGQLVEVKGEVEAAPQQRSCNGKGNHGEVKVARGVEGEWQIVRSLKSRSVETEMTATVAEVVVGTQWRCSGQGVWRTVVEAGWLLKFCC